jgi:hypothetical protein
MVFGGMVPSRSDRGGTSESVSMHLRLDAYGMCQIVTSMHTYAFYRQTRWREVPVAKNRLCYVLHACIDASALKRLVVLDTATARSAG